MRLLGDRRAEIGPAPQQTCQTVLHRRLEIHVEREWVSSAQDATHAEDICPVCGDTSVVSLREAVDILGGGLDGLLASIESGVLHLWQTASGEIAVCALSARQKK